MSQRLVPLGKRTASAPVRPQPAPDAPKVFVETYGCQMNVADSDLIGSVLADAGYATAQRADEADVILVNTCAVREKAEERVVARAAELGALKRKKPGTVLAIVGCMAEHLKEGLSDRADRKSTRLNSSHSSISYAVFSLRKKTNTKRQCA